jgi:CDP-diacylglycerol--glycerol-3-phosphate 3-phosphatidyltransferase
VHTVKRRLRWLPNALTIARLASLPVLFWLCVTAEGPSWPLGIFFAGVAFTDLLDGRLAALLDARTPLGRVLDPLADRLLMIVGLIGLLMIGRFAWPLVAILLARDVLAMAGFGWLSHRGVRLEVDFAGKVSSALSMLCVAAGLAISAAWVDAVFWAAVGLAVITFLHYATIAVRRLREGHGSGPTVTSSRS